MFEPTAGRLQLDINSLLVNIQTGRNEGIYICVRPLMSRMHTILVILCFRQQRSRLRRRVRHHRRVTISLSAQ